VDLTTLTKLSREQLNAYAKRAGVAEPERQNTATLIATLLAEGVRGADRVLQKAPRSGATRVARDVLSLLARSKTLQKFAIPPALTPSTQATPRPTAPRVAPAATAEPLVVAPTPEPTPAPALAATPTPTATATSTPAATPPTAAAPHEDRAATRQFVEEPIRTRSMARLLVAQGHRDRAVAILESIALANPHDLAARDDLDRLRADVPLDPELARLPEPHALPTLPDTGDTIELRALPGRELHISWTTTAAGQARANAVLGSVGELALRVVAITPDPTRVVRSEITERAPVDAAHEWTAPAVAAGSRCFAAIGMRIGGRFVAIAHAPARTID